MQEAHFTASGKVWKIANNNQNIYYNNFDELDHNYIKYYGSETNKGTTTLTIGLGDNMSDAVSNNELTATYGDGENPKGAVTIAKVKPESQHLWKVVIDNAPSKKYGTYVNLALSQKSLTDKDNQTQGQEIGIRVPATEGYSDAKEIDNESLADDFTIIAQKYKARAINKRTKAIKKLTKELEALKAKQAKAQTQAEIDVVQGDVDSIQSKIDAHNQDIVDIGLGEFNPDKAANDVATIDE